MATWCRDILGQPDFRLHTAQTSSIFPLAVSRIKMAGFSHAYKRFPEEAHNCTMTRIAHIDHGEDARTRSLRCSPSVVVQLNENNAE